MNCQRHIIVLYCAVGIALLLSGFIAFSMYFDIEGASFPLGIMTLLVTLLIGFQIYNALGIKDEMDKFKQRSTEEFDNMKKRMDSYEKKSDKKIDELRASRGTMLLSPNNIKIGSAKGKVHFTIESNTDWNIFPNNSGDSVNGLNVYPLNGKGNATITVEYDAVETKNYQQQAVIVVYYNSFDIRQNETVLIHRRHLP